MTREDGYDGGVETVYCVISYIVRAYNIHIRPSYTAYTARTLYLMHDDYSLCGYKLPRWDEETKLFRPSRVYGLVRRLFPPGARAVIPSVTSSISNILHQFARMNYVAQTDCHASVRIGNDDSEELQGNVESTMHDISSHFCPNDST